MEADTLSEKESRDMLARIERVQAIGSLVERGRVFIGGARATTTHLYQQAIMRVTVLDGPESILGLEIGYFRTIYGRVERKDLGPVMGSVVVDGESYTVTTDEGERVVVGMAGPIRVAQIGKSQDARSERSPSPAKCLQ